MIYTVKLLGTDGYTLASESDISGLKAAKAYAKALLCDYALGAGTTNDALGVHKVEIDDARGCVWDSFA